LLSRRPLLAKTEWKVAEVKLTKLTALRVSYDSIVEKQTLLTKVQAELCAVEETIRELPPLDEARNKPAERSCEIQKSC